MSFGSAQSFAPCSHPNFLWKPFPLFPFNPHGSAHPQLRKELPVTSRDRPTTPYYPEITPMVSRQGESTAVSLRPTSICFAQLKQVSLQDAALNGPDHCDTAADLRHAENLDAQAVFCVSLRHSHRHMYA